MATSVPRFCRPGDRIRRSPTGSAARLALAVGLLGASCGVGSDQDEATAAFVATAGGDADDIPGGDSSTRPSAALTATTGGPIDAASTETAHDGTAATTVLQATTDQTTATLAATTAVTTADSDGAADGNAATTTTTSSATVAPTTADEAPTPPAAVGARPRPAWLGTRTLPTTVDGIVPPQSTPEELLDRRLVTIDTLPPPSTTTFGAVIEPVPPEVLARSTWVEGCPVPVADLAYITMSFWGFDDRPHTGEMIINATVADDIVAVFAKLYEARFPIEEMRIVAAAEIDADPTGDGNNTTAFVCRAVTGGTSFSQHAYGLAVDINPFHNPYQRGDVVLPELARAYLDRTTASPGTINAGDVVVQAFSDIGWGWGGTWRSLKDYHHFSANNR